MTQPGRSRALSPIPGSWAVRSSSNQVYVYYDGVKYKYLITEKYEIKKTGNVNVTIPSQKNLITLITCINGTDKQVVLTGELMSGENY